MYALWINQLIAMNTKIWTKSFLNNLPQSDRLLYVLINHLVKPPLRNRKILELLVVDIVPNYFKNTTTTHMD